MRRRLGGDAGLLVVLVLGLVALAVMWVLVVNGGTGGLDSFGERAFRAGYPSFLAEHAYDIANIGVGAGGMISLVAVVLLVRRRRWALAAGLVAGFVVAQGAGDFVKGIVERSRPPYPIIHAMGSSFPSTDSAIAVGAVLVGWVIAGSFARRSARMVLIALGFVAAIVAGLLTIAFGDHYLSDVIAGWGLGAAGFAACVIVARRVQPR